MADFIDYESATPLGASQQADDNDRKKWTRTEKSRFYNEQLTNITPVMEAVDKLVNYTHSV